MNTEGRFYVVGNKISLPLGTKFHEVTAVASIFGSLLHCLSRNTLETQVHSIIPFRSVRRGSEDVPYVFILIASSSFLLHAPFLLLLPVGVTFLDHMDWQCVLPNRTRQRPQMLLKV
jgi:hypothetical protein